MSKIDNTISLLEAGIKAEGLRQKAVANNVANMETPGYRTIDVKFEELLAKALDSPGEINLDEISPQIYNPQTTTIKSNGNNVSLEDQVGKMIKNTLKHKAYTRLLSKKYNQIELAMDTTK